MNKKTKKIITAICIGAMTLFATPVTAMADFITVSDNQVTASTITPRWTYISDIVSGLVISGTTATVSASTEGFANQATKAKVIAELQVYSSDVGWMPVEIWSATNNAAYVQINETCTVTSGKTYRVKVTATVWVGDTSETQTVYGTEKTA